MLRASLWRHRQSGASRDTAGVTITISVVSGRADARFRPACATNFLEMKQMNETLSVSDFLGADHSRCDELFAATEAAVQHADWNLAAAASERFRHALLAHLEAEESLLFPAFERATGNTFGPTQVMRDEHRQMRDLLDQLGQAMTARSADDYGAVAETLLLLIQQHNVKEEQVLYRLCDQVLDAGIVTELRDCRLAAG